MEIVFSSLEELYNRLKPALMSKERQFKREGFSYLKTSDIWNYLKEVKWIKSEGLELYQMVDSIVDVSAKEVDIYLKNNLSKENREFNFLNDEETLL